VVQITELASSFVTGPTLQITVGDLPANTQKTLRTGIGSIANQASLNRHRAVVIAAQPAITDAN